MRLCKQELKGNLSLPTMFVPLCWHSAYCIGMVASSTGAAHFSARGTDKGAPRPGPEAQSL